MDPFFKGYGNEINGILHLSPKESYELCRKGAIMLDVRPEVLASYKSFDVPNYLYCYHQEIISYFEHLPKNRPIIIADAVGLRSKEIVLFLIEKGYTMVANMAGGITDWEKDELPMIIDNNQRLTGSCMCQLRAWGKKKS
jgi:rhodanese-related sulfurtransferase